VLDGGHLGGQHQKFVTDNYAVDPYGCATFLVHICPRGLLGKWVNYDYIFYSLIRLMAFYNL